jgi:hypothetical protein
LQTPFRTTVSVRQAIAEAAAAIGGTDRLVAWIRKSDKHETIFWSSIWPRLLPFKVEGSGERGEFEHNVQIKPGELRQKLLEHGLPTEIFGYDVPTIDDEPGGSGGIAP